MPLVSIITPVYVHASDHLLAAYHSILDQRLPAAWEWEWLVHVDGGAAPRWLVELQDDRVRLSADDRNHGPAVSRNLLLSQSTASHVKVLDADDQLTTDAIARDLAVIESDPRIIWVISRARDLREDGTFEDFSNAPEPGPVERGALFEFWKRHEFRLSVHPATLFAKRQAVVTLGGWTALPTSEDTALLLALDCCAPGYFIDECGMTYRKWAKQLTSQAEHRSAAATRMRCALIQQRCELLREAGSAAL